MKKYVFAVIVLIVAIALILLIPREANNLTNAVVNLENGDVAICHTTKDDRITRLSVSLFDKNGEELFSKKIFSDGGSSARLDFLGGTLCVYVGKTQDIYCFARDGAEIDVDVDVEALKNKDTFSGWDKSFSKYSYTQNDTFYSYTASTIFTRKAVFTISNTNGEKILYQSP